MTIIQTISLIIILIIVVLGFYKRNDFFSPGRLFSLVWAVSIFVTEFKYSGFQKEWSSYSWFVLILGLISFLLGTFISYVLHISKHADSIKVLRKSIQSNDIVDFDKLYLTIKVLFLCYTISFIVEVIQFGTIPILSAFPDKARVDFGMFGFHLFIGIVSSIMFLCVEYLVLKSKNRKHKLLVIAILLITFASYFLLLQKFNYILLFVLILVFCYYGSHLLTFKKLLIAFVAFGGFIIFLQSIRLSRYANEFFYVISKMKYSRDYAMFTGPYMYVTMNLENFARGVDVMSRHSYGLMTADWLAALTGIKHWAIEYFGVDYRKYVTTTYNTYPFLWDYYYDFGLMGVFIFPLITGIWISSIYYKMRITKKIKWVVIYSFFGFVILFSFFYNNLTSLNMTTNLFVLWLIHSIFIVPKVKAVA